MTTRAAQLTPDGMAGVATIAVVGEWDVIAPLLRTPSGRPLRCPKRHELKFCRFGEPPGDEIVLAAIQDDGFEIHCHGGVQVTAWILEQLSDIGVEIVPWTDFDRPFARELAGALTAKTASLALEVYLGHRSAEGLRFIDRPIRVAMCGPPNAGKSSLINAILGFQRAVVSSTPGTTRDAVRSLTALDGWPVEFIDTAGIRETTDPLEMAGIERALATAATADVVLWIADRSVLCTHLPVELTPTILVANKCDLVAAWHDANWIEVSAATGQGIAELTKRIVALTTEQSAPSAR